MNTVSLIMGYPCSGKSSLARKLADESNGRSYARFNRDATGGSMENLHARAALVAAMTIQDILLDNLYPTVESRAPVLEMARRHNRRAVCYWLQADIEDAQNNMVQRLYEAFGRIPTPEKIKASKDPGIFPPAALFQYRKQLEEPTLQEGWDEIVEVEFKRKPYPEDHTNKALILDYDSTLRRTISGEKYPTSPEDIEILPNTRKVLEEHVSKGYLLLGASNQSGVHKGILTENQALSLFQKTNELIGLSIEPRFCPHRSNPISCYCRKPMPGMLLEWVWKYKLDPSKCIFVGDYGTDRSAARRAGIPYKDQAEFFRRK